MVDLDVKSRDFSRAQFEQWVRDGDVVLHALLCQPHPEGVSVTLPADGRDGYLLYYAPECTNDVDMEVNFQRGREGTRGGSRV